MALVGSAGPVDSCEPAVGSRGPSPAGTLCGHLVRADRAWWAHELVQRCPGARAGGQLRVEGPHFLPTQRAAPSFPSLLFRAPPRCWTQAIPPWPGVSSALGRDKVARAKGKEVTERQGPWWASWRWRATQDRAAEEAEGHIASEIPATCAAAPSALWRRAGQGRAGSQPCPHARLPSSVPRPAPWPLGRACTLALRPPLFLSLLHPPPWAILALSGCPGFWQPHGLAV